jgi:hypothetical protein
VVNIGLQHLIQPDHIGCRGIEMLYAEDIDAALPLMTRKRPGLVLIASALIPPGESDTADIFPRQVLRGRPAIVVISPRHRESALSIHEWDLDTGSYTRRQRALSCLRHECQQLMGRHRTLRSRVEAAQEVGFNDCVQLESRSLQVQTEVACRDAIVIRTMIVEGGAVLDVKAVQLAGAPRDVEQRARDQHRETVAEVQRGEYC